MQDKEQVFDDELTPILRDLLVLARKHDIPMFCLFQLNDGPNETDLRYGAEQEPLYSGVLNLPRGDEKILDVKEYVEKLLEQKNVLV